MAFQAQHAGVCSACGTRYAERTMIERSTPGGPPAVSPTKYRHAGDSCPDPLAVTSAPCSACFLVHPAGACDR